MNSTLFKLFTFFVNSNESFNSGFASILVTLLHIFDKLHAIYPKQLPNSNTLSLFLHL